MASGVKIETFRLPEIVLVYSFGLTCVFRNRPSHDGNAPA